jgi:hypothetical protein
LCFFVASFSTSHRSKHEVTVMKTLLLVVLTAAVTICALVALTPDPAGAIPPVSTTDVLVKKTMRSFKSDAELSQYFRAVAAKQRKARARRANSAGSMDAMLATPAPAAEAQGMYSLAAESVTNVQHAGVDEGGIVKVHGNHLVVMRRGRLFTIAVGDASLKPISAVDAFGPEIDPHGTWYDEMLVSGNTIVVIGYSYQRGGTEVGLFDINNEGKLAYRSTYHLRSNDYYSSRNYASRLIGSKLIFYTPLYFYPESNNPFDSFPAVRKWHKGAQANEFRRIVSANRIYRPEADFDMENVFAMHTVTACDLANGGFDCQATSVLGPTGHVFYVSPDSVYVWASSWLGDRHKPLLFRMPLDGSGPSALRVAGSPVDQFSFFQSNDQHLNVLVRSEAKGDGMWAAEVSEGDVALMRIPIMTFSDGSESVPAPWYRRLQKPEGYTFQNRFVADYLIYGTGSGWGRPQKAGESNLFIVNWKSGNSHQLNLPHGVDRIEQLGSDAVIVGTDSKDLHFSSVKLSSWPEIISRYTRQGASQGELRSHGFFYKPENDNGGTLGLPISVPGRPGYKHLFENSAAILFLRNDSLQFREVGELGSEPAKAVDDQCRASCVDWYGNARPLFLRGRVFALLGYEIVEGRLETGRMQEVRRVNFAPGQQQITRGE